MNIGLFWRARSLLVLFAITGFVAFATCSLRVLPPRPRAELSAAQLAQVRRALPHWIAISPPSSLAACGIQSAEDRRRARVGDPILAYHPEEIPPDGDLLPRLLSGERVWYAPVLVGSRGRCLLQVAEVSRDSVRVDGIGYGFLAARIEAARAYAWEHGRTRVESVVRIFNPLMDLALARDRARNPLWLRLEGTDQATVTPISIAELRRILTEAYRRSKAPGELH